jgi:hypothetical protein
MSVAEAKIDLLSKLKSGQILANAIDEGTNKRGEIARYSWADVEIFSISAGKFRHHNFVARKRAAKDKSDGYSHILLDQSDVVRLWAPAKGISASTPAKASTRRQGKRPRIRLYLTDHYPNGVPEPAYLPRHKLRADILQYDPSLGPLDEGTLKTAVDEYNQEIAQHSAVSETIRK